MTNQPKPTGYFREMIIKGFQEMLAFKPEVFLCPPLLGKPTWAMTSTFDQAFKKLSNDDQDSLKLLFSEIFTGKDLCWEEYMNEEKGEYGRFTVQPFDTEGGISFLAYACVSAEDGIFYLLAIDENDSVLEEELS
jgi:hypothetical protein